MNDRDDYDQPRNRPEAVPPPVPTCPDCKLPFAPGWPASCICAVREFADAPLGEAYEPGRPSDDLPEGAVGICTLCDRPRYPIVPQFPTTRVCVCEPVLPLLDRPPAVPPPAPAWEQLVPDDPASFIAVQLGEEYAPPPIPCCPPPQCAVAADVAASYLAEIHACFQEGDPVQAWGWLFGLFNNHGTMLRADPEHTAALRKHAAALREYWVATNPQGKGF